MPRHQNLPQSVLVHRPIVFIAAADIRARPTSFFAVTGAVVPSLRRAMVPAKQWDVGVSLMLLLAWTLHSNSTTGEEGCWWEGDVTP